jgi:hypothetical protein
MGLDTKTYWLTDWPSVAMWLWLWLWLFVREDSSGRRRWRQFRSWCVFYGWSVPSLYKKQWNSSRGFVWKTSFKAVQKCEDFTLCVIVPVIIWSVRILCSYDWELSNKSIATPDARLTHRNMWQYDPRSSEVGLWCHRLRGNGSQTPLTLGLNSHNLTPRLPSNSDTLSQVRDDFLRHRPV